jgi:hypothetical protein
MEPIKKAPEKEKISTLSAKARALCAVGGFSSLALSALPLFSIIRSGPSIDDISDDLDEDEFMLKLRGVLKGFSYPAVVAASYFFAHIGKKLIKKATQGTPKGQASYHGIIGGAKIILALGVACGPFFLTTSDGKFLSREEKRELAAARINKLLGITAAAGLLISSGFSFKKAYDSIPDENLAQRATAESGSFVSKIKAYINAFAEGK